MKDKLYCVDPLGLIEKQAYEGDIGIDLRSISDPLIVGHRLRDNDWKHIDYIEYDTGIKLCLDDSISTKHGVFVYPRSSLSRYNLSLCNSVGVIDPGYRDTIKLRFNYIAQPSDYIVFEKWLILRPSNDRIYQRGDKIAQLVFHSILHPSIIPVENLPDSERGKKGFGSSGS
tara:strand:- start:564 stop:1079 length:516 start_codon:yes stop_codon:yes gene_type:complete